MMPYVSNDNALDFAIKVISDRIDSRRLEIKRERGILDVELKEIKSKLEVSDMKAAVIMYQESADEIGHS
jgi:hypothetical protein